MTSLTTSLTLLGLGLTIGVVLLLTKTGAVANATYSLMSRPLAQYCGAVLSLTAGSLMLYLIDTTSDDFYLLVLALVMIVSGLVTAVLPQDDYKAILKFKLDTMVKYRFVVASLLSLLALFTFYFADSFAHQA